jgi:signal transduction histidine kinase
MTAVILVAVLVPLVVVGVLARVEQRSLVTRDTTAQLEALASVQKARLQGYADRGFDTLALASGQDQLSSSLDAFVRTGLGAHQRFLNEILSDFALTSRGVGCIMAVAPDGTVVGSSDPALLGRDLSEQNYVQRGLTAANTGTIGRDQEGNRVGIFAGPIPFKGRIVGVLVLKFDLQPLEELVRDFTGLGETGETVVAARRQGGVLFLFPRRFEREAPPILTEGEAKEVALPMVAALAGEEAMFSDTNDYRGERVIAAARFLPSLGWGLVVKMDRSEAFASSNRFTRFTGLIAAVVVPLVLLIAALMARGITRRVIELARVAAAVTRGDLSRRMRPRSDDEIRVLVDAFNSMTDKLVTTNTELAQLASGVAHDLSEPLRAVTMYTRLVGRRLEGEPNPEREEEFRHFAEGGVKRIDALRKALSDYAGAGMRGRPFERVDVSKLMAETLEILHPLIDRTGATVTTGPLPATVWGDATELAQVFQNLISNAVKFMPEGKPPRVHVSATRAGGACSFSVHDEGIGIDPRHHERIFDLFSRLQSHRSYEGSGVGLATSRRIVERHGGRIWVESHPGQGSTFSFTIPESPEGSSYVGRPAKAPGLVGSGSGPYSPKSESDGSDGSGGAHDPGRPARSKRA